MACLDMTTLLKLGTEITETLRLSINRAIIGLISAHWQVATGIKGKHVTTGNPTYTRFRGHRPKLAVNSSSIPSPIQA
jgi:hypothetical protein